jgi:hypothetical protein
MDFTWWEHHDPAVFLQHDWPNPSREVGASMALAGALGGTLLEVGPGSGVDYARTFRDPVLRDQVRYVGYEPTQRFCEALQAKYPEAVWEWLPLSELPPNAADVVYTRAVLEHQPSLAPALSAILAAARRMVVVDWYRAPGDRHEHTFSDGVHYHTFTRADVLAAVARSGFIVTRQEQVAGSANEVWQMERLT